MSRQYLNNSGFLHTIIMLGVIAGCATALVLPGCKGSNNVPGATVHAVSMTSLDTFAPMEIVVEPGSIVEWTNNDSDPHAPIVDPGNLAAGGPDSDTEFPDGVPAGGKYRWTVPETATTGTVWFYHCRFHGTAGDGNRLGTGMVGVITVTRPEQVMVQMNESDLFAPETVTVAPGTTIVFSNIDSDPHAPIADPGDPVAGGPDSDLVFPDGVPAGQIYSWRVPLDTAAGTNWYYHCRFHGTAGDGSHLGTGMVGVISVN